MFRLSKSQFFAFSGLLLAFCIAVIMAHVEGDKRMKAERVMQAQLSSIDSAVKRNGLTGFFETCKPEVVKVDGMYLVCELTRSEITHRGTTASGEVAIMAFSNPEHATLYIDGKIANMYLHRLHASFTTAQGIVQ